jgi:hypothetical protein
MGIHDYCCFIQRNEQDIHELSFDENDESEQSGGNNPILVKIPDSFSVRDILSWNLMEFANFPTIDDNYSWDDCSFENTDGYLEVLQKCSNKWWETVIWSSPTYPGFRLVTFDKVAYETFVLQRHASDEVPWRYYEIVFQARGMEVPATKQRAYQKIIDSGRQNVWQFTGACLPELPISSNCKKLLEKLHIIETQPVFRTHSYYCRKSDIIPVSLARFKVLVQDNIIVPAPLTVSNINWKSDQPLVIDLTFAPDQQKFTTRISDKFMTKCISCYEYTREIGSYLCDDCMLRNVSEDDSMITGASTMESQIELLWNSLKDIQQINIPSKIYATFSEKGVLFTVELLLQRFL